MAPALPASARWAVGVSEPTGQAFAKRCLVTVEEMAGIRPHTPSLKAEQGLDSDDGRLRAAIAEAAVAAMKRCAGKGPTKVRAHIFKDEVLIVMSDCMTRQDRLLLDNGRERLVRETRECVHELVADDLTGKIEALTGRRVARSASLVLLDGDAEIQMLTLDRRE